MARAVNPPLAAADLATRRAAVLALQRTAGNAAVQRLLGGGGGGSQRPQGPVLQRQPAPTGFTPKVSAHPEKLALETGQTAQVQYDIDNFARRRGAPITWGGGNSSGRVVAVDLEAFQRTAKRDKATMAVTGRAAGSAEIIGTAHANYLKSGWTYGSGHVPVVVSSPADRAAATLRSLEGRRERGQEVGEKEQTAAEDAAVRAAETVAGRAKGSHGTEILGVKTAIDDEITRIEAGRARGYIQAVNDLNSKGLDKKEDYDAFGRSLLGNLLWAVSGLAINPAAAAVIGVVGAMMAQFSSGSPSQFGGSRDDSTTSGLKTEMERTLTQINGTICNEARRLAARHLAEEVASSPPDAITDAGQYATDLKLTLRHQIYPDVYALHLADADGKPNAGAVQEQARYQLLRQYAAANAALSDGAAVTEKPMSGRAEVEAAVDLVGGTAALKLKPYELVVNQMRSAAADMGCTIAFDPDVATRVLTEGRDLYAVVTSFDRYRLFGSGMPTRWFRMLTESKIVRPVPEFDNEAYLGTINKVERVTVHQGDLDSADVDGKKVFSARYMYFAAVGSGRREGDFIKVDVPAAFDIRYRIAP
ncbi:MAG: hypothetical protein LC792_05765 [Actinobacteria bacterium]|nr:hypothetical protein [Actinomycetota bacterium]